MIEIEYEEIRSESARDSPKPWYELEVNADTKEIRVVDDRDGGTEFDTSGMRARLSDVDLSKPAAIGVTESGELLAWNLDEDVGALRAHLAWWDGGETLTVLQFLEE